MCERIGICAIVCIAECRWKMMICSAHAAERQSLTTKRKLHRERRKTPNCWRMTQRSPALCARSHRKLFPAPERQLEQVQPTEPERQLEQVQPTEPERRQVQVRPMEPDADLQRDHLTEPARRILPITAPKQTVLPTAPGLQLREGHRMPEIPGPIRVPGAGADANREETPCTETPMWIQRLKNPKDAAKPTRAAI